MNSIQRSEQRRRAVPDIIVGHRLRDVVGLYLDPPAHSLVLSVDEKSQIQALDRTQPGLPMKKGRAGTQLFVCTPRRQKRRSQRLRVSEVSEDE
jgi:hypothetical protein